MSEDEFKRPLDKFSRQFMTIGSAHKKETLEEKLDFLDKPLLTKNKKKL